MSLPHQDLDDRIQGALSANHAACIEYASVVHVEMAGTGGAARHAPRSDPLAATAVPCTFLHMADCASTAIVTLNAQTRAFFGLSELTHAIHAAARERSSELGAGSRV